jgi:hypothetical protein
VNMELPFLRLSMNGSRIERRTLIEVTALSNDHRMMLGECLRMLAGGCGEQN